MKFELSKIDKFLYSFVPGIFLPIGFMWIYLTKFYPQHDLTFFEIIQHLYPSALMGQILMLSIMPNLILVFIFYKQDTFKLAIGFMVSAMPYLISSAFML